MPRRGQGWWLLGAATLLAGCGHAVRPSAPTPPALPMIGRGTIEPDLRGLPDTAAPAAPATPPAYVALTPHEAQCLAARAATAAKLFDDKQTTLPSCGERARLASQLLIEGAADARNKAAGDALEAYFNLVEAEGRLDLLAQTAQEVNESLQRSEELLGKGLRPAAEPVVLRAQLTNLRVEEGNLRVSIRKLNGKLRALLGLCDDGAPIWPTAPLLVGPDAGTVAEAVDTGLHHRPDLASLRLVSDNLSMHTLGIAKETLASVSPMLAAPSPLAQMMLMFLRPGSSITAVARQLATLRADRERQIAEEIRTRFDVVGQRLTVVALAQRKVKLEEQHLAELEEKKARGINVENDLSVNRIAVWKARGDLLHETVAWEIARVQLRQAQGLLARDCPADCEACASAPARHPHILSRSGR